MKVSIQPENPPWYLLDPWQVEAWLETSAEKGLSADEAIARGLTFGPNRITESTPPSPLRLFLRQFKDFMVLILMAAAIFSGVIGDLKDSITIFIILFVNVTLGFIQEYRAAKAVASIRTLSKRGAQARRDGKLQTIPAESLVPGDVVFIESGSIVPADMRLTETFRLQIDESILTGESVSVSKTCHRIHEQKVILGDQTNMAFKGTVVSSGRGFGIVVAVGERTELGAITGLVEDQVTHTSPLQYRLNQFGLWLSLLVIAICGLVLWIGLNAGKPIELMLMTAISLAVAAIPEALPAIATVSLALGALHMARRNALVKKLHAVETLGSVTYICSDKTGTLTQNIMRVEAFIVGNQVVKFPDWSMHSDFLRALTLNNDASFDASGKPTGEATETALLQSTQLKHDQIQALRSRFPRIDEIPFDSERMRMTTLHREEGAHFAIAKGAADVLLPRCASIGNLPLTSLARQEIELIAHKMAAEGMRVICFAQRSLESGEESDDQIESGLSLLGMAGLIDPPREESAQAVAHCLAAGITPVMMTGDHPETARAIAMRLGITSPGGRVMTGTELDSLDDPKLRHALASVRVFARVTPSQKNRIILGLQAQGEFVAMTGDGVNDAPALKSADIGIAMGRHGTDVAREAAPMILLDDNFATIVTAIEEGRRIYDNIRKFIRYALTCNAAELICLLAAPMLGLPLPLFPIQILWINLVTDGIPGIALAFEPVEKGVMECKPRAPAEGIFGGGMWQRVLIYGLFMAGACLAVQAYTYHQGLENWQTMLFLVLSLSQLTHIMAIRSERTSILKHGFFSNPILIVSVSGTFILQLCAVYFPWFNDVLDTHPLSLEELFACVGVASCFFLLVELEKMVFPSRAVFANRKSKK